MEALLSTPVVQAGMGGGLSRHELAAAVSEAGGLGTIGIFAPRALGEELAAARRLTAKPIAVNLLLPFTRPAHWRVAAEADVVVTFWGPPKRQVATKWLHQCGSLEEALEAERAGADGVIVQGVEAGGHVRGTIPAHELLAAVRPRVKGEVWLAGGIAEAADVRAALDAGADAAVAGTRFVATEESGAHPGYKARVVAARETMLSEVFGLGWHARHRVIENEAVRRWQDKRWLGPVQRATAPLLARVPLAAQERLAATQRPGSPLLSPAPALAGWPDRLLETTPLYAGETVARINDVRPAADVVRDLTP